MKNKVINEQVGQRVRRARENRGLTQTQLAAAMEIDASALSRLEAGRQPWTIEKLFAASTALDVSVVTLLLGNATVRRDGDAATV